MPMWGEREGEKERGVILYSAQVIRTSEDRMVEMRSSEQMKSIQSENETAGNLEGKKPEEHRRL